MPKQEMAAERILKVGNLKDSPVTKLAVDYLSPSLKSKLFLSLFLASIRILFSLAWPFLLYKQLFLSENVDSGALLHVIPLVLIVFGIAQWATYFQQVVNTRINDSLSLNFISDLWKKLVSLQWLSFKSKSRVYFFDIFMVDFWRIRHGIMAVLETVAPYSVISLALLFFLLYISTRIFFLYSLGFLITTVVQLWSNLKLRRPIRAFHDAWRKQSTNVGISIDQYDLLRMERGYRQSLNHFKKHSADFLRTNSAMLISQSCWKIIVQVVIQLTRLAVLIIGIYWINTGAIRWNEFFFTIFVIGIIQANLIQLPGGINQVLEALESFSRIDEFFRLESENKLELASDGETADRINTISIRGLDFQYTENQALFENYNLELQRGRVYLWVGPNGCGKSTLSLILMGLIKPNKGRLIINGHLTEWDHIRRLRNRFAFIHQDATLFSGTVKENVVFGQESPDKAWKMVEHSRLTALLPAGKFEPDRRIGERGEGLSGGEAKRLVLIREWICSAELVVLDEPLNHLDSQSIQLVTREIESLKQHAIVVIISHQPGFESIADEIVEINRQRWAP